jgi:hypothetical protein
MRIVTFPKGMPVRHVIRWMLLEADPTNVPGFLSRYRYRSLYVDMRYRYEDDVDWYQHAHDLAFAYGLILYQDRVKRWQVKPMTWKAMREKILKERGWE